MRDSDVCVEGGAWDVSKIGWIWGGGIPTQKSAHNISLEVDWQLHLLKLPVDLIRPRIHPGTREAGSDLGLA